MCPSLLKYIYFQESCSRVMQLPYAARCNFIKNNLDCGANNAVILNTFHWVFCSFSEEYSLLGIIITVICLALVFVTIAYIADGYVCTNLAVISKNLKLPDSIAGVTLLALGNGIPDIFTAFAGAELNHPDIIFGGLTGTALFDASLAAGLVIILRPFRVDTYCWWNLIFFICCYSILFFGFYFRNLSIWHSLCILIVYVLYGIFTVVHFFLGRLVNVETRITEDETNLINIARSKSRNVPQGRLSNRKTLHIGVELLKAYERTRIYHQMGFRLSVLRSADYGYSWRHPKELLVDFCNNFNFIADYDWSVGSLLKKCFIIMQIPWIYGLKLLLPAVVPDISYNDGWCKLNVMINFVIYPFLILFCFGWLNVAIGPVPIWIPASFLSSTVSVFIFFKTRTMKKPQYHNVLAYAGFIGAVALTRLLCTENIVILKTLGARLSVSTSWLSLTVLSWGNSITDLISAVSLSKEGMQNMGYSSLYGGPMFSCSVGIPVVILLQQFSGKSLEVFYGEMSPVGALFLFITLISSTILLPALGFEGRRSMGTYLILIYCTFFLFCLLMPSVIHPFGIQTRTQIQNLN